MHYVYILKLKDNSYYTGSTNNLKRRLGHHNRGECEATKNNIPVTLVWSGIFKNKKFAIDFEQYLKSSSGIAFRNKRLI
jgi:putative endonuclease